MKMFIVGALLTGIALVGCATQPKYQCDPSKSETTPASRFEINRAEGTAFDTKTKLTWKICSEGQNYSNGHCSGKETHFYSWNVAMQAYDNKGDSWRLPNDDESNSIAENRCQNPAINMAIFPDAPARDFWSPSSYLTNPSLVYVRLVRGREWVDPLKEGERKQAELAAKQKLEAEQAAKQVAAQAEKAAKQAVAQAENDAYVACNDKTSCDKTFSLTQIYISSMASQKIQVATDTIIETYNPTENGNIGMGAVKIPGKGSSAIIRISVTCKVSDSGHFAKYCESKKLDIYNGFRPFVSKMLGD